MTGVLHGWAGASLDGHDARVFTWLSSAARLGLPAECEMG